LFDKRLSLEIDSILNELKKQNCTGILCVIDSEQEAELFIKYCNKFPFLYCSIGTHPHNAKKFDIKKQLVLYESLKLTKRLVALGEIGLDFYYNFSDKNQQIKCFETQLTFAKENSLPVIIHSRQSNDMVLDILKSYKITKGVFHCFSGNVFEMHQVVNLGLKIGITGIITFSDSEILRNVVSSVPEKSLVVETDCPYLSPNPVRGKTNSPLNLKYIIDEIAKTRKTEVAKMEFVLDTNSRNLFNL